MLRSLVAIAAVGWLLLPATARARCLAYEPEEVTLTGRLEQRRLPGPPSYRSLARGDNPEEVSFLVLDEPVCVLADPGTLANSKSYTDLSELQLFLPPARARLLRGKTVRVTGTLSGAQTRAHRTPVVLTVRSIQAL